MALVWPLVNGIVVGDLSAYADTQRAWRKIAGARGDSWLVSLVHGAPLGRWVVVVVAMALLLLIAWRARPWTLGTRVWTVAYPLFMLATTPATSSILRYLLLIGPAWWPAPGIGARVTSTRSRVLLASAVAVRGPRHPVPLAACLLRDHARTPSGIRDPSGRSLDSPAGPHIPVVDWWDGRRADTEQTVARRAGRRSPAAGLPSRWYVVPLGIFAVPASSAPCCCWWSGGPRRRARRTASWSRTGTAAGTDASSSTGTRSTCRR